MKIYYFKSDIGNFGDDLNEYLWDKLIIDFDKKDNDKFFVGIGSILDERLNLIDKKIIFGSGSRGSVSYLELKNSEIRFVRGPKTSKLLNNVPFITDSAYCLRLLEEEKVLSHEKKYKYSVIPYFRHLDLLNWNLIERVSGIHFIDVSDDVTKVLREIKSSENLFCGAMHGAIVADAYRIPWVRMKIGRNGFESYKTSDFKWSDWMLSMKINEHIEILNIKSIKLIKHFKYLKILIYFEIIIKLMFWKKFHLSNDAILQKKLIQLNNEVNNFNN